MTVVVLGKQNVAGRNGEKAVTTSKERESLILATLNPLQQLWVLTNSFLQLMFSNAYDSAVGNVWITNQPHKHMRLKAQKHFFARRLKSSKQCTITTVVSQGRLVVWVYFRKKEERTPLNPITLTKTAR